MIFLDKFKYLVKSNPLLTVIAHFLIAKYHFIYTEKEYSIVNLIDKPKIIDVGGHNGESIYNFLKYNSNCKIISIEPNKKNYEIIKSKYKNDKRIKFLNYCIDKKKNNISFFTPMLFNYELSVMSSTSLSILKKRIKIFFDIDLSEFTFKKKNVKTIKIDDLKQNPNLIKIDTEGSEYNVLLTSKKTIKKNKPIIIVEYNHSNFKKVLKLMKFYGYNAFSNNKKFVILNLKQIKIFKKKTNADNVIFLPSEPINNQVKKVCKLVNKNY